MKQLILASTSPRRSDLLKKAEISFIVDSSDYEEDLSLDLSPHELTQFLSKKKAQAVAKRHTNSIVLGADTIVVFRGKILGKPNSDAEAHNMLMKLNGNIHQVITGFTLIDTRSDRIFSHSVETIVTFKQTTPEDIATYVDTGEPRDKAGAYAIQGKGRFFVDRIEGSLTNVIGLPLKEVKEALTLLMG
jgi:septum formation protein